MGSWFSNIHVRKNDVLDLQTVAQYITNRMTEQKYLVAASDEDADVAFALVSADSSGWIGIYSDMIGADSPKTFQSIAEPMSQALDTDVLGIACFDSDYLYLNLINEPEKVNAWLGVGSAAGLGIRKRTALSKWKNKVIDFLSFSEVAKKKYIFAEDVLEEVVPNIQLPQWQSAVSYEDIEKTAPENTLHYFYFKLPEDVRSKEPPVFVQNTFSLMPCFVERPSLVEAINRGGASRGLTIYFMGSYVEQEEITFSGVQLIYNKSDKRRDIQLEKLQLPDGSWCYCYHDPGFPIPEKVDPRLPMFKQMQLEMEREITVRFIPQGNPRKVLDITVVMIPDKNPAGQIRWNLLDYYGSKATLIAAYNKTWEKHVNHPYYPVKLLSEEDFD